LAQGLIVEVSRPERAGVSDTRSPRFRTGFGGLLPSTDRHRGQLAKGRIGQVSVTPKAGKKPLPNDRFRRQKAVTCNYSFGTRLRLKYVFFSS
jgi:hypothetical protein